MARKNRVIRRPSRQKLRRSDSDQRETVLADGPGVGRVRLLIKPQHLADGVRVGIQGTFPEIEAHDQGRRAVLIGISEPSASERVHAERREVAAPLRSVAGAAKGGGFETRRQRLSDCDGFCETGCVVRGARVSHLRRSLFSVHLSQLRAELSSAAPPALSETGGLGGWSRLQCVAVLGVRGVGFFAVCWGCGFCFQRLGALLVGRGRCCELDVGGLLHLAH
jgi:hypothetical protein